MGADAAGQQKIITRKRKWRLAELVRQERETKKRKQNEQPSFVFHAPHMDSRRPQNNPANTDSINDSSLTTPFGDDTRSLVQPDSVQKSSEGTKKRVTFAEAPSCVHIPREAPIHQTNASKIRGGDAMLYDKSLLPHALSLLLDVLSALESAMSLLRTRQTRTTFKAVRDIVAKSTRREFTLSMLSQLAHIIPEAVAVLPGYKTTGKPSDNLIIRLDEVTSKTSGDANNMKETESVLGDCQARLRRAMLHKRLLAHVAKHHEIFLKTNSIVKHVGDLWHPEFDLEKDVISLPAPPLCKTANTPKKQKTLFSLKRLQKTIVKPIRKAVAKTVKKPVSKPDSNSSSQSQDSLEEEGDIGIPTSLLERVRARQKAKEVHVANAEIEVTTSRSLLSKLPCTMDTISSVLRAERRFAMGWSQLLAKVGQLHPKKWPKDDLEKQLAVIMDLGSDWCKKIELKSSRGGFAFRVVSEAAFSTARAKVAATKVYPPETSSAIDGDDVAVEKAD